MSDVAHSNHTTLMTGPLTFAMALATGAAVANIYYNQPMLNVMAVDLPQAAPLIVPTTQLSYALGLFALVPLGDVMDRRRLIVIQLMVLTVALLAMAFAQGTVLVLAASIFVGFTATVAQQIIPLAAQLAAPSRRGATVGMLMSGLLGGVLLSRTIAGVVATEFGWRAMYMIAAPIALATAAAMWVCLPSMPPAARLRYAEIFPSMVVLWRTFPQLRRATFTQALLFAGFAAFWAVLPFYLAEPRFGLGAEVAGLFGVVAAVGLVAAPIAGRIADARGPHLVIKLGAIVAMFSWVLFAASPTLAALMIGVALLDFGMHSALVSNQTIIYSLRPEARARLNTIFMGSMFLGSAIGSAVASAAWQLAGWEAVACVAGLASATAVFLQVLPNKSQA